MDREDIERELDYQDLEDAGEQLFSSLDEQKIIKVQVSIYHSSNLRMMLLYSENRRIFYEGVLTDEVKEKMQGRLKAFFKYHLEGTEIVLDEEIVDQEW